MKKLTVISIISLLIINLLTLPIFINLNIINSKIEELVTTIPNNTIYVNSNSNHLDLDNSKFVNQLSQLNGVSAVTAHNIYRIENTYYDGQINPDENQIVDRYTIPVATLDQASQQKYDIIAGQNLSGDGQVVISSSLVNHLGKTPEQMIGEDIYSLEIVGVYDDPNNYQQIDAEYSHKLYNFDNYLTTNLAYTIDSKYQEQNLIKLYDLPTYDYEAGNIGQNQIQQIIEIKFDQDDTATNLDMLLNEVGNDNVYLSNLGIQEPDNSFSIHSLLKAYGTRITISLLIVDVITIGLLIYLNRKEQ